MTLGPAHSPDGMHIDEFRWAAAVTDAVVRRDEALACGWTVGAIAHRVRSGRWQTPLPGVLLLVSGVPTHRQRLRAALAWGGPDAVLTSVTGCRLHGLEPRTCEDVHLALPHARRPGPQPFLIGSGQVVPYRTTRSLVAASRTGLPVLPVARCVVDACLGRRSESEVRALVAAAVQTRRTTVEQLTEELDAAPRRGSGVLRIVLAEVLAGARSAPEAAFLVGLRQAGLTGFALNADVHDDAGGWLACCDVVFADLRLIIEVDGQRWHLSPESWAADLERHTRLEAAGWTVLRYPASRVLRDAAGVAREVAVVAARITTTRAA